MKKYGYIVCEAEITSSHDDVDKFICLFLCDYVRIKLGCGYMLQYRNNYLSNESLCRFLLEVGFNDDEIIKILFDPSLFITYYDKIDVMVKKGYEYLVNKNFNKEQIKKMILRYPGILTFSDEKKKLVEDYFDSIGISQEEFKKIIYRCPNLYGYTIDRTNGYTEFLREMGYALDDVRYILKNSASLYNRSVSTIKMLVNDLKTYGFRMKDILVIGRNYPMFWTNSFDKIKSVVETFCSLGFSKEQSINILVNASSLVGYDCETIKKKFMEIVNLGFIVEEVRMMINDFPAIIASDIDRTRRIVEFFTNIGLRDKIVVNSKSIFKQSVETSYIRYMFFKDKNIDINSETYRRLFYGWSWFERAYGVNKDILLERYNIDMEIKNRSRR